MQPEEELKLKSRRTILADLVPSYMTIERPERRSAKRFKSVKCRWRSGWKTDDQMVVHVVRWLTG